MCLVGPPGGHPGTTGPEYPLGSLKVNGILLRPLEMKKKVEEASAALPLPTGKMRSDSFGAAASSSSCSLGIIIIVAGRNPPRILHRRNTWTASAAETATG